MSGVSELPTVTLSFNDSTSKVMLHESPCAATSVMLA